MTDLEYRRRLIAAWGISEDIFADFLLGIVALNPTSGTIPPHHKMCMTPLVQVTAGHSITFASSFPGASGANASLEIYLDSDTENPVNYYSQLPVVRTISSFTPNYGQHPLVRMPFSLDAIADCYIKDNTTGEYLWRGTDYIQ